MKEYIVYNNDDNFYNLEELSICLLPQGQNMKYLTNRKIYDII